MLFEQNRGRRSGRGSRWSPAPSILISLRGPRCHPPCGRHSPLERRDRPGLSQTETCRLTQHTWWLEGPWVGSARTPLPDWARFEPDGQAVILEATGIDARWSLEFGRLAGTSPVSGTTYDEEDARPRCQPGPVEATVRATAWDLDLWLWSRGNRDGWPSVASWPRRERSVIPCRLWPPWKRGAARDR